MALVPHKNATPRWLAATKYQELASVRGKSGAGINPVAEQVLKLVLPLLVSQGHCILTEAGDVECYLMLATDPEKGIAAGVLATLVVADQVVATEPLSATGELAKQMCQAFATDFPEAVAVIYDDKQQRMRSVLLVSQDKKTHLPLSLSNFVRMKKNHQHKMQVCLH